MRLSNTPRLPCENQRQAWGNNDQPSATHMAKKTHPLVHPCLPGTPPANNARIQPFPWKRLSYLSWQVSWLVPSLTDHWPAQGTVPTFPIPDRNQWLTPEQDSGGT